MTAAADRLRDAADRIEQTATAATPGPWQPEYAYRGREVQAVFVECDGEDCGHDSYGHADGTCAVGAMHADSDNRWAVLAGPQLATPLAAWLRSAAVDAEMVGADPQAYAVADAILSSDLSLRRICS